MTIPTFTFGERSFLRWLVRRVIDRRREEQTERKEAA